MNEPRQTAIPLALRPGAYAAVAHALCRERKDLDATVFGNHDIDYTGAVCNPGFDEVHPTLYVDSDPPLLLTHMPIERLPDGFINVHGHTHNNLAPLSPFHINVCVEQLRYRPVDLNRVLALARALLARARPLEETTAEQIDAIAGPEA